MAEQAPPAELVEALQAENQRLQQELYAARQVLHQRAEPILTAIIDSLATVAQLAAQGHPGAQAIVSGWKRSLALAEQAGSGIVVARNLPANGSGPG